MSAAATLTHESPAVSERHARMAQCIAERHFGGERFVRARIGDRAKHPAHELWKQVRARGVGHKLPHERVRIPALRARLAWLGRAPQHLRERPAR